MPAPAWGEHRPGACPYTWVPTRISETVTPPSPHRFERQRSELWYPVVRGFNPKSVQAASNPWASENEGVLEDKGETHDHLTLVSHGLWHTAWDTTHEPQAEFSGQQDSCPQPSPWCGNESNSAKPGAQRAPRPPAVSAVASVWERQVLWRL